MPAERVIGHYRIIRSLGMGGMGEVFVAQDTTLKRLVAIKSIHPDRRLDDTAKRRFLREAQILSSLDHPHICKIYDFIESDGDEYLVLEYIEGITLTGAVRNGLDPAARLRITEQLLRVLAAAHAEGIVHRDFKPDNVMVMPSGDIKVLDFGLAYTEDRLRDGDPYRAAHGTAGASDSQRTWSIERAVARSTESDKYVRSSFTRLAGTPQYMSPEQARGEPVTVASDLYALGLILQFMFTERPPYDEFLDVEAVLDQARRCETRALGHVEADVKALIMALKSPSQLDRPTAPQALETLRRIRDKPKRRLRRTVATFILAAIVLAGVKYTMDVNSRERLALDMLNELEHTLITALDDLIANINDHQLAEFEGFRSSLKNTRASLRKYDPGRLPDDELETRLRLLRLAGDYHRLLGEYTESDAIYLEAVAYGRELRNRHPQEARWAQSLGDIHFYVGFCRLRQNDFDGALDQFESYRALTEALVALDPGNPRWQLESAMALTNLGAVHADRNEIPEALEDFQAAYEIKARLVETSPQRLDWLTSLANAMSWLAKMEVYLGRLDAALGQYEEEFKVREDVLRSQPDNPEYRKLLAVCHSHLGEVCLKLGRTDDAAEHARAMNRIARALYEQDQDNFGWKREYAVSHRLIAEVELARVSPAEAIAPVQEAMALFEDMLDQDQSNADTKLLLAISCNVATRAALELEAIADAAGHSQRAADLLVDLDAQRPDYPGYQIQLARHHLLRRRLADLSNDDALAQSSLTRAVELMEPFSTASNDPNLLDTLARAYLLDGQLEKAEGVLARLDEMGYVNRELDHMRQLAGGVR